MMDAFSRTPSRLNRLKTQMKTILSRTSSSSGIKPSRIIPTKRHITPSERVHVPPRHLRTQSEVDPNTYYHAHPTDSNTDLDPYSTVHRHPSVRPPRHRSADYYVGTGASPLTPNAYALLEDYFPPQPASAHAKPTSASGWSNLGSAASLRPASVQPALSAFARSTPSRRPRPTPTASMQTSPVYARHAPLRVTHAPTNKTELAAILSDPYYQHAGTRPPARPHGARAMPNAAIVPVYVNVYGTGRRRGWLGGGRRK